jgi:AcrR family transcriptional regulator
MVDTVQRAETREAILRAAAELFGREGFAGTSLRDIVREAGVNLSAVNYYFGTKEQLYEEVIRHVLSQSIRTEDWAEAIGRINVRSPQEVADMLYREIRTLFLNYVGLNKPEWYGKLLTRGLLEADPRVEAALSELDQPIRELLRRVLPGLIPEENLRQIDFWIISVFAQIHHYLLARRLVIKIHDREQYDEPLLDEAASYVARNSVIVLGLPEPRTELGES